jgi:hypothetical protein
VKGVPLPEAPGRPPGPRAQALGRLLRVSARRPPATG